MKSRFTLLLTFALLGACEELEHGSIPTDQIYPRFTVNTDENGLSRIRAEFMKSGNGLDFEPVALDGSDELSIRSGSEHARFEGPGSAFETELTTGNDSTTYVSFSLHRIHFKGAFSSGTLPYPMDLVAPGPGEHYSVLNDDVTVVWQQPGSGDDMWIDLEARCASPQDPLLDESATIDVAGDPGIHVVKLSDHIMNAEGRCQRYAATLTLHRTTDGRLDSGFAPKEEECGDTCVHGEHFRLSQVRSVELVLTP